MCFEKIDAMLTKFMDSALAICGALLGFLLTILTIINSIETRRMKFIRESGNFPLLNHYLKVGILTNIISISLSFILPILSSIKEIAQNKGMLYTCVVFIVSFTWLINIRFSIIFVKLFTDPPPRS